MAREIEFIFSSRDDEGYNEFVFSSCDDEGHYAQDWFRGGWLTISAAENAETVAKADAILRSAYKGPDVDGVEVRWIIE